MNRNDTRIEITCDRDTYANYDTANRTSQALQRLTMLDLDVVPRLGEEFTVKFDGHSAWGYVGSIEHNVQLRPGGGKCDHLIIVTLVGVRPKATVEITTV